jgi:recombination protein RecR
MSYSSELLQDAVNAFSRLPGIGKKTALRLALHLIKKDKNEVKEQIIDPLAKMIDKIKFCIDCHNLSDDEYCSICKTRKGKTQTLCVVESIRDVMAIEDTGQYKGLYHVLGGLISPLDGVTAEDLNMRQLFLRVESEAIKEVIMAVSPTIEGETTTYYIGKKLKERGVNVSQLARGISFGGELEYTDELTLGKSILSRTNYTLSEL